MGEGRSRELVVRRRRWLLRHGVVLVVLRSGEEGLEGAAGVEDVAKGALVRKRRRAGGRRGEHCGLKAGEGRLRRVAGEGGWHEHLGGGMRAWLRFSGLWALEVGEGLRQGWLALVRDFATKEGRARNGMRREVAMISRAGILDRGLVEDGEGVGGICLLAVRRDSWECGRAVVVVCVCVCVSV